MGFRAEGSNRPVLLLAMQTVEGSNPFSRSRNPA